MRMLPLSTIASLRTITVRCSRCDRAGRLSVARLIREHGPEKPTNEAWETLNADCPHRESRSPYQRCDLYCPEIAEVVLGKNGVV